MPRSSKRRDWPHLTDEDLKYELPPEFKKHEVYFGPGHLGLGVYACEYSVSRRQALPKDYSPISRLESIASHWHWYYLEFKYNGRTNRPVPEPLIDVGYALMRVQAVWPYLSEEQRTAATATFEQIDQQLQHISDDYFEQQFTEIRNDRLSGGGSHDA